MFNDEYVKSQSKLAPFQLLQIILNMNEENVRESISILRLNNYFSNDDGWKHDFWEFALKFKECKDNPNFKETFGFKMCNLLNEYNILQRGSEVMDIKNNELWHEHFPMTGRNIIYRAQNGVSRGITFNKLQTASFKSMINQTTESFKQYCKEVELLFLASGQTWIDFIVVLDNDSYKELINYVNNGYGPINKCSPFGWRAFSDVSVFEDEINKIGCDKFIEIINSQRTGTHFLLSGEISENLEVISRYSQRFSQNMKQKIVESIKKIPTPNISLNILYLAACLLTDEPELRKSSQIIKHLPKLKNWEFPSSLNNINLIKLYNNDPFKELPWIRMGEFTKIAEIELGINDTRPEYSKNKLFGLEDNYFNDKNNVYQFRIEFIKKYFSIIDNNAKKVAIKEFVLALFDEWSYYVKSSNLFVPAAWKKTNSMESNLFLLKDFLKEEAQRKDLKEMLKSDKELSSVNLELRKCILLTFYSPESLESLEDLQTQKRMRDLINSCFDLMIEQPSLEMEGSERDV